MSPSALGAAATPPPVPEQLAPYELSGDERGVLVVHGFTGTPYDLRVVGERLHREGMTVSGIRLAGHEGGTAALAATTWRDWVASAEAALSALQARCRTVGVVGLSLGALIALRLSRQRPDVAAVASLAVPLALSPLTWLPLKAVQRVAEPLARRLGLTLPAVPKSLSDIRDPGARRRHPRLVDAIPVAAALSLLELIEEERRALAQVTAPLLIVHSRRDHTALYAGSELLARESRPRVLHRVTLERSFHVLGVDVERHEVAEAVAGFFARQLPRA